MIRKHAGLISYFSHITAQWWQLKTTLPLMQGANINYYSNYCRIKTYEIYNIYSKKMKIQSILLKVNARKTINTASFILHLQLQK